jgi:hypothetical protein
MMNLSKDEYETLSRANINFGRQGGIIDCIKIAESLLPLNHQLIVNMKRLLNKTNHNDFSDELLTKLFNQYEKDFS